MQKPNASSSINTKFVKPSELNLDFINPTVKGIKGAHGIGNNSVLGGP